MRRHGIPPAKVSTPAAAPGCIDCGNPATVYRDLAQGIVSCADCEATYRAALVRNAAPAAPKG